MLSNVTDRGDSGETPDSSSLIFISLVPFPMQSSSLVQAAVSVMNSMAAINLCIFLNRTNISIEHGIRAPFLLNK